jgi:hypothetical protein
MKRERRKESDENTRREKKESITAGKEISEKEKERPDERKHL